MSIRDAVRFYLWLQWLAATQFAQCFEQSRQQQMPIGLYVAIWRSGWRKAGRKPGVTANCVLPRKRRSARRRTSWGRWGKLGLPPMDPHVMAARGYPAVHRSFAPPT